MGRKLMEDPSTDITDEIRQMSEHRELSPAIRDIRQLQETMASLRYEPPEDPEDLTETRYEIMTGQIGPREIIRDVKERKYGASTAQSLLNEWDQKRQTEKDESELPRRHRDILNDTVSGIEDMIDTTGPLASLNPSEERKKVMAAAVAKRAFIEWSLKNPDAGTIEAMEQGQKITERIINNPRYQPEQVQESGPYENPFSIEPPEEAIQMLRQDPTLAPKFDEKYGEGAAERYLNQDNTSQQDQ
jgi:hypothetical protein